jgi:hypothetical protein
MKTKGQLESWYHSHILRIPHGLFNPTKRYLNNEQIQKLFTGTVEFHEKIDGKMGSKIYLNIEDSKYNSYRITKMFEDISCKNSVHDHIIKYTDFTEGSHIIFDRIIEVEGYEPVIYPHHNPKLQIGKLHFPIAPSISEIHQIMTILANRKSILGADKIEGIVIKNYGSIQSNYSIDEISNNPSLITDESKTLMGKWINEEFDDKLHN